LESELLNKNIWEKLKNNPKSLHIKLNEYNETVKYELKRIMEYAKNLVLTQYERKTSHPSIKKTLTGYTVQLNCFKRQKTKQRKNICKSQWYIRFNIETNELKLTCNYLCNHLLPDNSSKYPSISYFYYLNYSSY